MKVALIGVGQAGGKIVDAVLDYQDRSRGEFVTGALAVNTAKADLLGLENVPMDQRVLYGQDRVKGHGAGADNVLGSEIAREDVEEVMGRINEFPTSRVDAFLVVAGLGGGTGSGGAPVVASEVNRVYEEPVYGLGVLPSRDEGGIYHLNAARSFTTFVREVDNLVAFDNQAWRGSAGESLEVGYGHINQEIARRLGVLFMAGEPVRGSAPESVVDASEIINTFASGGVSTIGYAASDLGRAKRGLLDRLGASTPEFEESDAVSRVTTTVRLAALGRLTLPCEIDSAERALVIVAGPPDQLSRKGLERSVSWLEDQTGTKEVRGGDYPLPGEDRIAALVVLSGVTDVPRIRELQRIAVESQRNIEEIRQRSPEALRQLIWADEGGEIEPLF